ncbi:DJ-1/PfpI family protein [Shumkonia mesophila]|uniref:DJ-1/PfpI family protein n=1 Tax=Shumkonia mesophila TaxID=2838854 RepID=UPI00293460F7|nr:DJ-1/PfpI family protein [Shumkonia mesophila]
MRKRVWYLGLGGALLVAVGAVPFLLAAGDEPAPSVAPIAIPAGEHAQTLAALKPPKRARPAIALLTLNDATEVSDFLVAYGILGEADVADVTVVAPEAGPVKLYPSFNLRVEAQATLRAFEERYPEGADYVVVPAVQPRDDARVVNWIKAQHAKGAKIVSICNGTLTLAAAGLLDGRRATAHWSEVQGLREAHPTLQWVPDRRYVVDRGILTSTGVSASIPVAITLVEAIGGRAAAEKVAKTLGVATWDARHATRAFQLTREHKKTFLRNKMSLWRHETLGLPVERDVDEIALGLTVDTYFRTEMTRLTTAGTGDEGVKTRRGLVIYPDTSAGVAAVDAMLPAPPSGAVSRTLDRELARIASRYDRPTAAFVALTLEYPWNEARAGPAHGQ